MRYGFKSVSMDDISRELGMSKKTLYTHFADKNELVEKTVEKIIEHVENQFKAIMDQAPNPILASLEIASFISNLKNSLNPGSLFDLKKYFKNAWDKVEEFRLNFAFESISKNLRNGKEKQLFKAEIDIELTSRIYAHLMDFLVDPDLNIYQNYEQRAVHFELLKYHMRSICTDEGMEIFNNEIINYTR